MRWLAFVPMAIAVGTNSAIKIGEKAMTGADNPGLKMWLLVQLLLSTVFASLSKQPWCDKLNLLSLKQAIANPGYLRRVHTHCFHRVIGIWDEVKQDYMNALRGDTFAKGVVKYLKRFRNCENLVHLPHRVLVIPNHLDMSPMVEWWCESQRGRGRMLRHLFSEQALKQIGIDTSRWIDTIDWDGLGFPDEAGMWPVPRNLLEMDQYFDALDVLDVGNAISLRRNELSGRISVIEYLQSPNVSLDISNIDRNSVIKALSQTPPSPRARELIQQLNIQPSVDTFHHFHADELNGFLPSSEDEAMRLVGQLHAVGLLRLALHRNWKRVVQRLLSSHRRLGKFFIWDPIFMVSGLLNHVSKGALRQIFPLSEVESLLTNVAICANFPWLEAILMLYQPDEILAVVKVKEAKCLLSFMMHLIPTVPSYQDHQLIDKSSASFSRWVLLAGDYLHRHNPVAQKRALSYYFDHLFDRVYRSDLLDSVNRQGNVTCLAIYDTRQKGEMSKHQLITKPTFTPQQITQTGLVKSNLLVDGLIMSASIILLGFAMSKLKL